MSKNKILSMLCSLAVIAAGAVYFAVGKQSLYWILPVMTAALLAMSVASAAEARACKNKRRDLSDYISALCMGILALCIAAATVLFYVKGAA